MNPPEPPAGKRPFWKRRRLLVAGAAIAFVAVGVLLASLPGSKSQLIDTMPVQQSRLKFLGPLQPPISRAWQRFKNAWLEPPPNVHLSVPVLTDPDALVSGAGKPVLTNVEGVSVWIIDAAKTWSETRGTSGRGGPSSASRGMLSGSVGFPSYTAQFRLLSHSQKENDLAVFVVGPRSFGVPTFVPPVSPPGPFSMPSIPQMDRPRA